MADTKDEIINGLDHFIARGTATPSAAEQAATWVIENPPSRAMGRYTYGRDGYLAGHAAGEQAGIEKAVKEIERYMNEVEESQKHTTMDLSMALVVADTLKRRIEVKP